MSYLRSTNCLPGTELSFVTRCRYHWMFNATAYNHAYGDTGLFCVHSASPPTRLYDTTIVIARELAAMAGKVGDTELKVFTKFNNNFLMKSSSILT